VNVYKSVQLFQSKTMSYLTVNADDFGLTQGVTDGIRHAMQYGIVTSTSAMACADGAIERLQAYAATMPDGIIGAHLQLTGGTPVLSPDRIPSLVTADGIFCSSSGELPWGLDAEEMYQEWLAQIARLRACGIEPAYLDTHHNVHVMGHILPVMVRIAKEMNIPVRAGGGDTARKLRHLGVATPDMTIMNFLGGHTERAQLIQLLVAALAQYGDQAVIELCCHPGFPCNDLQQISNYHLQREEEINLLTDPEIKKAIADLGITLITMNQVRTLRPAEKGN
jgi:chitin disaccharide deacetylase